MSRPGDADAAADPDLGAIVEIEVVEIGGTGACSAGLQVGDRWTVDSPFVPAGMCMWAWSAIMPLLTPLRFGGALPWEAQQGSARVCCLDPDNPVVFRLTAR